MKAPAILFILISFAGHAQIKPVDPAAVDIVRDRWGVPHIFAKTDAGVSYGLAWAHAEDDFKTIQLGFLAGKAMLGQYTGKSGATVDYVVQFMRCRELVDSRYEEDISPVFKTVLQAYCDGINSYARSHPKEVLIRKMFPINPKDMLTYSVLQLAIAAGADNALKNIINGSIPGVDAWKPGGSNAYAFNSSITKDGDTYLAINSHQPLQGPVAWYEAHLCSEEGWNILGALFPGAPIILLGCNEFLGWAHTVNYPDKLDVYQLEMNPNNKYQYKVDGQWKELERTEARMKVKIAGLKITVKKEALNSIYGPAMRVDRGVFAIRTGALMEIRALEQWYHMNKARSFSQFKAALNMNAISGYNIIYADRYDTIYYVSNGKIPLRNKGFNWKATLPGNTSQTLWSAFHPFSDLPQVLQPASGYIFNSNHSPFNATAAKDNIKANQYDPTMGYETHDNNRSERFMNLIAAYPKINYAEMKKIKYDLQLPLHLKYQTSCDTLFLLNQNDHPDLAALIQSLNTWDRKANVDSKGAALFSVIYYKVVEEQDAGATYRSLTEAKCLELLRYSKHYLEKYFGTTEVSLGQYQKLVRGQKSIALPGIPDVIASMLSVQYKNGMVKGDQGESYIELVKFTQDGPEIETINSYGASTRPGSTHYADQMELFIQQKTKPMTLDKSRVYKEAERIYHPQ
ncbi:MAG: penicillin acylase family protein [Cyclobacteriaceae bacterium]|nr:penicillin acylase family protein [Cyclobacteriaceae bacterium]MDH4297260.1 penicillin acylase family protein [Cyclobacteriaceae bacterium]MDH5247921.1 penicillin acylase family protein [Cyclobacteriaceae bacterium]